ncbi:MAG: 4Fe-4S cluster-binding domain-containing protein [bacterium]|nr:4Fe-4S cluster-binding domain-containing protein [bacterium]
MEYVLFSCGNIKNILEKKGLVPKKIISFEANEFDGKNIISVYKYRSIYNDEKILIPSFISDDINVNNIYKQLVDLGFEENNIYFIPIEQILGDNELDYSKFYNYGKVTYLDYLEINIIDCCNMNCKGCSHFANLAPRTPKNFNEYYNDFKRLRELIPHIFKIRIMGGEPFLNKELKKYIEMIKKIYPYTDLRVVTNGLLIKKIDDDMVRCLKKNNIILDISVYPPIRKHIDEIVFDLRSKGINAFLEHISSFKPILLKEKQKYPYKKLENCRCINLQSGYLSACPLSFTIKYFNNKYGDLYSQNLNLINIYDNITGYEIKKRLEQPFELCDYCAHYRDDLPFFKWEQRNDNSELSDWVYKKGKE